ncbi:hypothetical protein [Anaerovorax odorimutans]|uniref:hypothetical protein n=1 Tax=Anaerovorax odorimutans TaxID=109327 RepID=UPI00048A34B9|nr:hypothetical protein [Anaerovorax odorimutans]
MTSYIIYGLVIILTIISAIVDIDKTKKAIKIGFNSFKKLLPSITPVMIFIGITLSILSPSSISMILGKQSGGLGIIVGLITGSIAFMPSFIAFPLGESLLSHGAGYPQIAAFISSLMAVGIVSLAIEIQYFGKKAAVSRNILALITSVIFSLIIWGVM